MTEDFLETLGTVKFDCVASGADSSLLPPTPPKKMFFSFVLCTLDKAKGFISAFHLSFCRLSSLYNSVSYLFLTIINDL